MGNCLEKPVSWVDDDEWSISETASPEHYAAKEKVQQVAMTNNLFDAVKEKQSVDTTAATEIKIRISKKHLEDLLLQVEGKGLALHHVLEDLVSLGQTCQLYDRETRHWRPNLQTIVEVPEC